MNITQPKRLTEFHIMRIDRETKERLADLAAESGVTPSELSRRLLLYGLDSAERAQPRRRIARG